MKRGSCSAVVMASRPTGGEAIPGTPGELLRPATLRSRLRALAVTNPLHPLTIPLALTAALLLSLGGSVGLAQQAGPLLVIHGAPDTTTAPPEVRTIVSVIERETALSIAGLEAGFEVLEDGVSVDAPAVSYQSVGLAVAVVVDRGGISAAGDPRLRQATDLVRELAGRLTIAGAANDDMLAIVGVGEGGALAPEANFSTGPVDVNLALNALVVMEGESVRGGTPLYEGLDEALRLLTENPEADVRAALAHRRCVVLVLSDGVDPGTSDEAREQDVIGRANAAGISIYAVGMAPQGGRLSAEGNLVRLAAQTDGLYQVHNDETTHQQVLALFDRLVTQRQQYVVAYHTHQPQGSHALTVRVSTALGVAEASTGFASILRPLQMSFVAPGDGQQVVVPYRGAGGESPTTITLTIQTAHPDGVARAPTEVRYFANGAYVGSSARPPDFAFAWPVGSLITPTAQTVAVDYTLRAEADDPYLRQTVQTAAPVTVRVSWEPLPFGRRLLGWLASFWWLLCLLVLLGLGLLILLILLVRTRGELARQVVSRTSDVVKGVTQRLGGPPQRATGQLVVIQGANMGREFPLASPLVRVGRDPQFCDLPLFDPYVSNPHFSVQQIENRFFVTDLGSTNGTRVNGQPLPAHQRAELPPEALIETGQTRLQFKRLGKTTRQLGAPG